MHLGEVYGNFTSLGMNILTWYQVHRQKGNIYVKRKMNGTITMFQK